VRHLLAADDLSRDRLDGQVKLRKRRGEFLVCLRSVRSLYPPGVRLGLVLDNHSPHLSTRDDPRVGQVGSGQQRRTGLCAHQCLLAEPHRGPVHRAALLHLGRHRPCRHAEQASMIRRDIAWRNRTAHDRRLGEIVNRANIA
jgi:hypothetical protein